MPYHLAGLMRRRDLVFVVIAAVVIGLLAWLFLARGESRAPEEPDGSGAAAPAAAGALDSRGNWLAYLRGGELRIASLVDGTDVRVLDLAPLGGCDRHFASTECYPDWVPACSYRPPVLSWGP
jgi:hypothetical protein